MARSRRKKTTRDRLIEAALYAAPAPVRTIASNPTGFRLLLIAGAALMFTGILTLDWSDGTPQFKFHRDKASQVKEGIVNDLSNQVQGWNLPSPQGNGNLPGYFTQTPSAPYQQPTQQQYGSGSPPNPPAYGNQPLQGISMGWGQTPGQANGYYYPNGTYSNGPYSNGTGQPGTYPSTPGSYPNAPYSNPQFQNPSAPNGQYPQWPNQQPQYPQTGNSYPGNYRR